MNKRGRNELWVVEICLVLCYGLRAEMKETVRFNRKKRRPTRVTFYTAQRPELHTEKREKEPMNVTGDVRPKAEENSFPSKIFRLFIFFFLGVAGYCWTRQPKKKKVEGEKIFIGSMRFHSLPACASHGWELSKRTYSSIDIYMQKAWERADVNAPARPLSVPFFARNISWHLCLMALTSKKRGKIPAAGNREEKKKGGEPKEMKRERAARQGNKYISVENSRRGPDWVIRNILRRQLRKRHTGTAGKWKLPAAQ